MSDPENELCCGVGEKYFRLAESLRVTQRTMEDPTYIVYTEEGFLSLCPGASRSGEVDTLRGCHIMSFERNPAGLME